MGALFVTLRPLENSPLPGWDGSSLPAPESSCSAAVGTLLCVASAATLTSVRWGVKDDRLYCVAIMLAALVGLGCWRSPTAGCEWPCPAVNEEGG
ncbi:MAG: hypothetical protein JO106_12570 [Mycobacterium sp.]|nr:hypothetical protein [Mycobacterium sp.]